jgi:hypothetical protein
MMNKDDLKVLAFMKSLAVSAMDETALPSIIKAEKIKKMEDLCAKLSKYPEVNNRSPQAT